MSTILPQARRYQDKTLQASDALALVNYFKSQKLILYASPSRWTGGVVDNW